MPRNTLSAPMPPEHAAPRSLRLKRLADGVRRHWVRVVHGLGLAGGLCLGGWMAAAALPAASFLSVDDIVVHGNQHLSDGEVLALVSGLRGAAILSVDLAEYQRRLAASPWLTGGTLRRRLPSTIEVFVTERRPMAIARFGGRPYLLDASGAIVDGYGPRFAQFDFPIVDGLGARGEAPRCTETGEARDASPVEPGGDCHQGFPGSEAGGAERVDPTRMALAARLLTQLASQPDVLNAVSQIDVADPHDAVVLLEDDVTLLHLGAERFLARLRLYAELAPLLREEIPDIDEVDLRFDPRVYVRPAGQAWPASSRRVAGVADGAAAGRPGGGFASRR